MGKTVASAAVCLLIAIGGVGCRSSDSGEESAKDPNPSTTVSAGTTQTITGHGTQTIGQVT